MPKLGELAALGTALFWTVSALSFEYAAKRVGTLSLNLLRLVVGFLLLVLFSLLTRGILLPTDATPQAWLWLSLSGLAGFVLGDLLLFRAFIEIGARLSMLIYSSVPPMVAILGWITLGESPTALGILGMAITVGGIALVVLKGTPGGGATPLAHLAGCGLRARPSFLRGVLLAVGGSLGQAVGLVLSKVGAPTYNAFSATQIRVIAGMAGFLAIIAALGRMPNLLRATRDGRAMGVLSIGAFFGPFLGVSLGLIAVQNTTAGIASTIMATTPVLIIVPSVLVRHEKVSPREIVGALVAVAGVALLFLT
jgi:drug/metabolite transporter (DMT)-like permease